ncbi:DUF1684 domain-containing protein [Zobellia uliginosa]|uniref:DUF1684 domain-containing protein n=1 Tax=Zobellia uliginosa TaxID=143224 RepID=UPI001C072170|nr:DUF1684 domain-containing protein [Zobellia uliginosa]MBU2948675.1 DUF1684 domain-containing protein [Zobellia uliginosa]
MKTILAILFLLTNTIVSAQEQSNNDQVRKFQDELNAEFKNPEKSPLSKRERKKFTGHDFYPINENLRVAAKFKRILNPLPFQMKTTTNRTPTYEKYGEVVFEIEGQQHKLTIYQSHRLRQTEEFKDYLFLPFTDLTNGEETYGGGRYIDLRIPDSDQIVIDFNKAYNPYCAYNNYSSCPIPPKENDLPIKIEAGVKAVKK